MFDYLDTLATNPQFMSNFDSLLGPFFPGPSLQLDLQALQMPDPTFATSESDLGPLLDPILPVYSTLKQTAEPQDSYPIAPPLLQPTSSSSQFNFFYPSLHPFGEGALLSNQSSSQDTTLLPHSTPQQHSPTARCPKCKIQFTGKKYRSDLVNHCMDVCYPNLQTTNTYSSSSGRNELIQCPIPNCPKQIKYHNWKSNMSDHLQTHDTERFHLHPCPTPGCTKVYMRKNSADDCRRRHEGDKFRCDSCLQEFDSKYEREKHHAASRRGETNCVPVVRTRRLVVRGRTASMRNVIRIDC
ncbi:hypothetical protein BCR33DRAFT_724725 [Rhizoclosmatium globosum]|uniref:C2H2-type domain-containing protein n=1 Tax=Rhizoclosmatium globosum TaxID=329046 RepID=A0A1Y2B3S8_9FUNG|nr:hypothetical protein BCR33DRAFT_724725 [Rhizoclosmatium globosum]|eukprot:ORY29483.1 hypothetical protein BCR33DRAFT_724725 [Rhizoclosmatium globosum]